MNTGLFSAMLIMAASSGLAMAQEIKGDVTLGHSAYFDDTSVNATFGTSSLELGIGERASVQLDGGMYGYGFSQFEAGNVVLHGIFDVAPSASAGVFVGIEDFAGDRYDFQGLEFGQSFGSGSFEVYAARGEEAGIDGTVLGVEGHLALGDAWGLGVKLDHADFNAVVEAQRFGLKGVRALGQGSSVYAEVGSTRIDALGISASEPFFGVGLNVQFGQDKATFGQRTLSGLFPGL